MKGNTPEQRSRQGRLGKSARGFAESVLRKAETVPELAEKGYLFGATAVSLLNAAHREKEIAAQVSASGRQRR